MSSRKALLALVLLFAAESAGAIPPGWLGRRPRACSEGEVTARCKCGPAVVRGGYCCGGIAQATSCGFNLYANVLGTGDGTITSDPAGVDCGTTCIAKFNTGTAVTVTASATSGTFKEWTGACSGTGACVTTMSADHAVGAVFTDATKEPSADSPQTQIAAAQSFCAGMAARETGVKHYFCDCQTGAEAGCTGNAGDDARANASDNSLDCTDPALPCRTFTAASATFRRMAAGDSVLFCKGGAFEQTTATYWHNPNCTPATNMRAAANATTCDMREYTASWGGTAQPIIRQVTASTNLMQFWDNPTDGLRVMNLNFQGGGSGCGNTPVGIGAMQVNMASHALICGNTFEGWHTAINLDGNATPMRTGWDVYGNTIRMGSLDAFLGFANDLNYEANYIEDVGSCTGTTHAIYPSGLNVNGAFVETRNLRITGNHITYVNRPCTGPVINGHGTWNGVLIENNLIQGTSTGSTGGCYGIAMNPDPGYNYTVQYAKNLRYRRNRVESRGWNMLTCASCPGAIIENNIIVAIGQTSQAPLIPVPFAPARTIQPDPITTGALVRNNTIIASTLVNAIAIPNMDQTLEGTDYVIANNAFYSANNAFASCWKTGGPDAAYTVTNNSCFNGLRDNTPPHTGTVLTDPLFVSVPSDLTPGAGSPLIGAGTATWSPGVDFFLDTRPSPPAIGAIEP